MTTFVLAAYPLSQRFRLRLESDFGADTEFLTLNTLRRLPLRRLLRELRARGGRPCVLALEDAGSRAVLPLLQGVAALASPASVLVVVGDDEPELLSLHRLPLALATLMAASAAGTAALARSRSELRRLLTARRSDVNVGSSGRALYLNPNLWLGLKAGGSVGHVAGVVNGLARSGLDVEMFSAAEPVLVDAAVRFRQLEPPAAFGLPSELNYARFQRSAVATVTREALRPVDFLYQRLSVSSFAGAQVSRNLAIPLVLEYNGSEVWAARQWGSPLRYESYARDAEAASIRHAHLVVTVSAALEDELVERGVPPQRIVFHPNGVDESLFDPARFDDDDRQRLRAQHAIPDDAVVAGFIGTFGRWHGVDVLARAIAHLVDTDEAWLERHRLRFLLVGDGLRMQEVLDILEGDRYRRRVVLAGLVPQAEGPRYLAACDLLLSPHVANADGSRFFGSPTKLFEYMAMEKGIVASNLDQIGDVLADSIDVADLPARPPDNTESRLAVLVPPGREDALANAIRFLVEREDWRRALGANARRAVLARYTWQDHVAAIVERLGQLR